MRKIETTLYKFTELSEDVQKQVIEKYHDINVEHEWYEETLAMHREKIEQKGFDVSTLHFKGFSSQGDGAMFTYNGFDDTLKEAAIESLQLLEREKKVLKNAYLSGKGSQSGLYYHERSCSHQIYFEPDGLKGYSNIEALVDEVSSEIEYYIKQLYEQLCEDLYSDLRELYYELTSDECVSDALHVSSYEFYQNGTLYKNY